MNISLSCTTCKIGSGVIGLSSMERRTFSTSAMSKTSEAYRFLSQIKKLKECFDSLDGDGSGSIGIEELEDPLIGLGFAETRKEVQDMIDAVDEDGSGMIEFEEFLSIIKGSNATDKTTKINKFFKDMTTGKLASEGYSFNMFVQKMRRDYLKDAIMGEDPGKKEFGIKIMKNVAKQLHLQNLSKPPFSSSFTLSGIEEYGK